MQLDIIYDEHPLCDSMDDEKLTDKELEAIVSTENNSQLRQHQENEINNESEETNAAAAVQMSIKRTEVLIFSGK